MSMVELWLLLACVLLLSVAVLLRSNHKIAFGLAVLVFAGSVADLILIGLTTFGH